MKMNHVRLLHPLTFASCRLCLEASSAARNSGSAALRTTSFAELMSSRGICHEVELLLRNGLPLMDVYWTGSLQHHRTSAPDSNCQPLEVRHAQIAAVEKVLETLAGP